MKKFTVSWPESPMARSYPTDRSPGRWTGLALPAWWAGPCARCPEGLPWHRVIKADGSIASGVLPDLGRDLLAAEGVAFLDDDRVDMEACRWEIEPPEL